MFSCLSFDIKRIAIQISPRILNNQGFGNASDQLGEICEVKFHLGFVILSILCYLSVTQLKHSWCQENTFKGTTTVISILCRAWCRTLNSIIVEGNGQQDAIHVPGMLVVAINILVPVICVIVISEELLWHSLMIAAKFQWLISCGVCGVLSGREEFNAFSFCNCRTPACLLAIHLHLKCAHLRHSSFYPGQEFLY